MKRSLLSILFLIVFSATAFAGDPIPGVDVGVGKNPSGQQVANTKTDNDGKFTLTFKEGSYTLNLSYDAMQAALRKMGKTARKITLTLSAGSNSRVLINDHTLPTTITLTAGQRPINITIPAGSTATISGEIVADGFPILNNLREAR